MEEKCWCLGHVVTFGKIGLPVYPITNLFTLEDYTAKQLVIEFLSKGWNVDSIYRVRQ